MAKALNLAAAPTQIHVGCRGRKSHTVVKNYNLYIKLTSSIAALVVISCGSDCVSVIRSDHDNLELGYSEHCGTVEPPLKRIREPANP